MKEISDTLLACLGISNTIILLCILIIIAKNIKQIMIDSSYPIVLVLLSNVASSICKSSIVQTYGMTILSGCKKTTFYMIDSCDFIFNQI